MDGNQEVPAPSPPEGGVETRNSRDTVVKAFDNAFSLMDADPAVSEWTKQSLRDAKEKTIGQGRSTFTNTFENHHTGETYKQEEGIPVEDILQFLGKKVESIPPNTPEWQNLVNIAHTLYRNSQPYFKLHHHEYPTVDETSQFGSRVHQEAYHISRDQRATGDQKSDWFKAIDALNNRRELVLPPMREETLTTTKPTAETAVVPGTTAPETVPATVLETTPQQELEPFFGFDIVNYEEAISKEAHLEARKSVTEDLRRGKWYKFWHWPRKVGMRLIEPAMVNFRKERLGKAMRGNNLAAGQLATLERFKEGRAFAGEKREEAQGRLKGLITEQILKPIIDGQITTPEQVQKLLADFVHSNLNDGQVRAIFGPGANDFGDVAEVFATDVLEQGLSLKAYMEAHQKTLQQMDKQIGINLDYARLGHMTDTRNYVDKAVAWAKRRQSENLARGARGLGFSGVILNPAVVGVAAALGVSGLMRSVGMAGRLAALSSFFIGGIAGGSVAGMRRYYELGWDRSQHAAERVSGAEKPGPQDKRREELEKRRYNTASVEQLLKIDNLLAALGQDANQTNQEEVARRMVEIEQRLDMSSLLKKDLIDYQSAQGKQTGANELTKAVVMLRAALQNSGADVQGLETRFKDEWSRVLIKSIEDQDKSFQSYRLKEAGKAAVFGGVAGLAGGFVSHEVLAGIGGFFEAPKPPVISPSVPDINTIKSMFPGIHAVVDPNGHINVSGAIPPDAQAEMQRLGFTINHGPDIAGAAQTIVEQRPVSGPDGEWLKNSVNIDHREWYSYNQSGSQLNELRLYTFKEGDTVILDVSKMEEGFQHGLNPEHINVQEVIKNGEAGVFISRPDDPQNGFWVMDKDDGVIDGHVRLDPNAPGKVGEVARMVLNQGALQQLPDGNIATELRGHQDVFNIGANGKPGFIEAGRIVERNGVNVLQDFATIRGTSPIPETIGMPITVPGEPTPTFDITPPPVPEAVPTPEVFGTPIIPIPFAPRHPLEPLRKPREPDRPVRGTDQTSPASVDILKATVSKDATQTENLEVAVPTDAMQRRIQEIQRQAEARGMRFTEDILRDMATEEEALYRRYERILSPVSPIDYTRRQSNPYGINSCVFASVDNISRAILGNNYDPVKHSEKALVDALGGQEYARLNPGGFRIPDDIPRLENQLRDNFQVRRSNSLSEILQAVERGAGVVLPIAPSPAAGAVSHVGAILPGQRLRRREDGVLEIQVVDSLTGAPVFKTAEELNRFTGLRVDHPYYYKALIIEKRGRGSIRLPRFNMPGIRIPGRSGPRTSNPVEVTPPTETVEAVVSTNAIHRRIQELQAGRQIEVSPPFATGQGGKFVWQEVQAGQGVQKKSDDLYRGYLMVEPENIAQALGILLDVARKRKSQGQSTDFKWLMMSRQRNEDINDPQNIGKYETLQPQDPRIALYGDTQQDVMEILRDLSRDSRWKALEAGRINKYGGLVHAPRRPGTSAYIDESGAEWRSLNFNDMPGYSEEEAGFPDWRERKQGEPTIPVGPAPQPDLGDVLRPTP